MYKKEYTTEKGGVYTINIGPDSYLDGELAATVYYRHHRIDNLRLPGLNAEQLDERMKRTCEEHYKILSKIEKTMLSLGYN